MALDDEIRDLSNQLEALTDAVTSLDAEIEQSGRRLVGGGGGGGGGGGFSAQGAPGGGKRKQPKAFGTRIAERVTGNLATQALTRGVTGVTSIATAGLSAAGAGADVSAGVSRAFVSTVAQLPGLARSPLGQLDRATSSTEQTLGDFGALLARAGVEATDEQLGEIARRVQTRNERVEAGRERGLEAAQKAAEGKTTKAVLATNSNIAGAIEGTPFQFGALGMFSQSLHWVSEHFGWEMGK